MKRLEIQAPAKINLYLDVLGKRIDGYHEINSLLVPVSLCDQLILEAMPEKINTVAKSFTHFEGIPWPVFLGLRKENLVTRAAHLLKEATGYRGGARIVLKKNIPIAGGMGGGSSDAAAVLQGLNTLWNTGLSREEMMALGSKLGSDIPALVHGGAIKMNGRGECIQAVRRAVPPSLWLVLVNPGLCISTGDIYSRYRPDLTSPPTEGRFDSILSGLEEGSLDQIAAGLFNALQRTVFQKYPLLEIIYNELEKANAKGVLLSGTGSTVFALVENRAQGCELEARIRGDLGCPLWTCVVQAIEE
ncbi:MAG: 4-(cytidine 5'-diphospho)-2-C-methyl-D-erythritol kinase [Verrucomicrobia bacterium]|nr:4-(cytidine 5'-diphospho)-2-C-methyl-D-erythritol kinase [Verrucomicrobiota bacterium]MBU4246802.1 4-(cytidine 5'-diphospho)-2-C-methyl-D-erythritol kinase [Verrucomicrobiota bacterium]MBU4290564.1 4-(cytidine 5'-diphospho)-2-C-methyl-D-erythritol kinase [Verrucomicrobiota bacterium]MBU4496588.1 4-(cytidine 5'-diphospho)-2-C-methyl-D-erythritol kinase [Verrucomicrobiota bacterium]MCG2681220.1 4-(cytidine 5'-diphospho)-2-C-methyl-D-erythritol kinase [Kiritimatiellia bacterium]